MCEASLVSTRREGPTPRRLSAVKILPDLEHTDRFFFSCETARDGIVSTPSLNSERHQSMLRSLAIEQFPNNEIRISIRLDADTREDWSIHLTDSLMNEAAELYTKVTGLVPERGSRAPETPNS